MVVRQDWDTVVWLSCIGVGCIVHKDHLAEISIKDSQILAVHSFRSLIAVVSEETMMDIQVLRVKIVKNYVGIA